MHRPRPLFGVVCIALVVAVSIAERAVALTFVVNNTAESDDGTCDAGDCTLVEAINAANANAGLDDITFDPAVFPSGAPATIALTAALPTITDPAGTTVDGTGAGVIIDGAALVGSEIGLSFHTSAGVDLTDVTVRNVTVVNFPAQGIRVCAGDAGMCQDEVIDTVIANVTANGNGGDGVYVTGMTNTNSSVTGCTLNNNDGDGVEINAVNTNIGAVANDNTGNGNGFQGVRINAAGPIMNATASGNTTMGNMFQGVSINSATSVTTATLNDNTAEMNMGTGVDVNASGPVTGVTMSNNTANMNDNNGINVNGGDNVSNVQITGTTAMMNGNAGVNVNAGDDNIGAQVSGGTCSDNDNRGVNINAGANTSSAAVSNVVCEGNMSGGVNINAGDDNTGAQITGCICTDNDGRGVNVNAGDNTFSTTVMDTVCTENMLAGININAGDANNDATIENCTSSDNDGTGIVINAGADCLRAIVRNNTVDMNQDDGVVVNANTTFAMDDAAVERNLITNNMDVGVSFGAMGSNQAVRGNIICGNGIGLELQEDGPAVNAEGNWWGDASGPTHPNNAGGTGDTVVDGDSGAAGTADFDPWIDNVTGAADPNPTALGMATQITFQFSDTGATVFLGAGPGDLNATVPPFTITTDNGLLTASTGTAASVTEFINMADGTLAVNWTPDALGTATISVTGPCGLTASQMVEVVAADLSISKDDVADPVNAGDNIDYTISVMNNGPDDATNVVVTDTLPAGVSFRSAEPSQGNCNIAAGVLTCELGGIANGGSATIMLVVSADVPGDVTNTASVAADEFDPDESNSVDSQTTTIQNPTTQPSGGVIICGIGLCGGGSMGVLPLMLLGLGLMKRRSR